MPGSGYILLHDVQQQRHTNGRPGALIHDAHTETVISKSENYATKRKDGGAERDRTDDLMLAKHALSQLSYSPEFHSGVTARPDLHQLKRRRAACRGDRPKEWWAREDLNFRPHAYQARALTN